MNTRLFRSIALSLALTVTTVTSFSASANVVIAGTRIIYPSDKRDVSVQLTNRGTEPALVQAWLDNGNPDANPDTIKVPFTLSRSVARIEAGKGYVLRLAFTGTQPLPSDRESVFYFNLLDIPPEPKNHTDNSYLQFAFRTRIKVFYRPKGLPGSSRDAMNGLHWSMASTGKGKTLEVSNPSPYYVSFAKVTLHANGKSYPCGGGMVAPRGHHGFKVEVAAQLPVGPMEVDANAINDYGGTVALKQHVTP